MSIHITQIDDRTTWNSALASLPGAHILQTWEWGDFKQHTTGWQPMRIAYQRGGAVVGMVSLGVRRVGPVNVLYAPKGPVFDTADSPLMHTILDHLQQIARHYRAVWLKIDPDVIAATGDPTADDAPPAETMTARHPEGARLMGALRDRRWRFSADQVQFRNTIALDLTQPADALLAGMNQSTRRKIRMAEKAGVVIRPGGMDDLDLLYALYQVTGARDDFLIRPRAYYVEAWQRFISAGLAQPFIAEYRGRAIAHVILYTFGRTCWYMYGASADEARDVMPNYLLQWHAIQWAQARGLARYDFWGAPDVFDPSDRMWGVYQFKRGFRGVVTRHIGAWDYVPYPPLYSLYERAVPRARAWLRRRTPAPAPKPAQE